MMRLLLSSLGLVALTALAVPAQAQDTAEDPAAEGQPPAATEAEQTPDTPAGEAEAEPSGTEAEAEQPAPPEPYVRETFQDWRMVCVPIAEDREGCYMVQTLEDTEGNAVAQVSITPLPPAASPRAAAVEVATPLEVLLSEDVLIAVDGAEPKRYRYTYCLPRSCFARFALTADEVEAFKAGARASVVVVPLAAPDQAPQLTMSLAGFTAAFDAVAENAQE